jgi:bacterioferritin-associated ferredoxin
MRKSGRRVSHVMVSVAHARCRDFKMQNVTSWVAPRGALPISGSRVVQDCAVGGDAGRCAGAGGRHFARAQRARACWTHRRVSMTCLRLLAGANVCWSQMFACICRGVTEADVYHAGMQGAVGPEALISALGLDDDVCCGRCLKRIDDFVEIARRGAAIEVLSQHVRPASERAALLSR